MTSYQIFFFFKDIHHVFLLLGLFFFFYFIFIFIFGCVGSLPLCEGSLQLRQAGAALHRGAQASHHHGLSLRSTGSRRAGSAAVAHGPSRSAACGILPDQGSNPRPLHRQADSQPLRQQGSPLLSNFKWGKMNTLCYIPLFILCFFSETSFENERV